MFPGSLIFPPPGAPGGGKMRDPGNKAVRNIECNQDVKDRSTLKKNKGGILREVANRKPDNKSPPVKGDRVGRRKTPPLLLRALLLLWTPFKNNLSKWQAWTPAHGLASTLRMRTAISPGQWQPWINIVWPVDIPPRYNGLPKGFTTEQSRNIWTRILFWKRQCLHCGVSIILNWKLLNLFSTVTLNTCLRRMTSTMGREKECSVCIKRGFFSGGNGVTIGNRLEGFTTHRAVI